MPRLRYAVFLALCSLGCSATGQNIRSLTILHTSDLHARFLPDAEGRGGFAYVAGAIQQEKAKAHGSTLVLHAGDFVQGSPVSTIFEGLPVWEVANHLGIDVNTLGNHEFDYGWRKIPEFLARARFPTVSANVVNDQGRLLTEKPYVIREVNGMRIAVIGALTADLPKITKTEFRGPWKALPVAKTVEPLAARLRPDVDLVVLLSHTFDYEDDEVLQTAKSVDVIVAGHNHGGQEEVKVVDGRICVKVRSYGRELGRLDLWVDVANKRVVSYQWQKLPIHKDIYPPDEVVAKLVDHWEAKVSEIVDVPIGRSGRRLGSRDLKPLIERTMARAAGADLAYMNRGGIRDALPEGEVLARHVWNILPFGNSIYVGSFLGKDLPKEVRGGQNIDRDRNYVVATNSFIGDRWREQGSALRDTGELVRDVVIESIRNRRFLAK